MAVLNIRPVESGQSKAVIGIAGQSGDGKTYTALLMARGMVDKASEIGFLDTENKRGSLYADILDGKFMIGDLHPPFSPKRYSQAIQEFQEAGVKVLVIDSITHEYEGTGGLDDIANAPKANGEVRKVADWNTAKREHRGFMNILLQSNMNIICCIRARDKVKIEVIKGKQEFVPQGLQPVCEKNFMFEMTVSVMMGNEGKTQQHLKLPSFLREAFGNGQDYLGIETGKKIREWLERGDKPDPEIERIKSEALLVCEKGHAELMKLWESLTKEQKVNKQLRSHFALCGESAKAYDAQNSDSEEENPLDMIKALFKELESKMEASDCMILQSVIDTQKTTEYDKALYKLKKLKDEQQAK